MGEGGYMPPRPRVDLNFYFLQKKFTINLKYSKMRNLKFSKTFKFKKLLQNTNYNKF